MPDSGVSSVSSLKQIQHLLGSSVLTRRDCCSVTAVAVACSGSSATEAASANVKLLVVEDSKSF